MATKVTDLTAVSQSFIDSDNLLISKHVTQTSGVLIVGEEYTILDFQAGDDFSNVATVVSGVINTTGCVFTATGTTPTTYTNGSTLAYYVSQKGTYAQLTASLGITSKTYKFSLRQSAAGAAPTIVEHINTLSGTPTPSWSVTGSVLLTLTGEFPTTDNVYIANGGNSTWIPIIVASVLVGYYSIYRTSADALRIDSVDASLVAQDIFTLIGSSRKLMFSPIEVYP